MADYANKELWLRLPRECIPPTQAVEYYDLEKGFILAIVRLQTMLFVSYVRPYHRRP